MQTQNITHIPITVPQMGEGLIEVRIVEFLKRAGDAVRRDEPLIEVETDKAVLAIESPVDGIVEKWEAEEDDLLPVGAVVGHILAPAAAPEKLTLSNLGASLTTSSAKIYEAQPLPSTKTTEKHWQKEAARAINGKQNGSFGSGKDSWNRNSAFSPRVRLYCQGHGVSLEEMRQIPRQNEKIPLRIADVERWLHARTAALYEDRPLSRRRQQMTFRMMRARHEAIPAIAEIECDWHALETAREKWQEQKGERVSALELISWCVVRALENHPRFRSALIGEHTLREYKQVHLGIAVGLPDDELTSAVLSNAGQYEFADFIPALRASIERARTGEDAHEAMQIILTKLSGRNIRHAVPVVVPPSVATLFIGAPYDVPQRGDDDSLLWKKVAALVMTFDHRFINGMGAADFLEEIGAHIAQLPEAIAAMEAVTA